jgi:hypothetical protein
MFEMSYVCSLGVAWAPKKELFLWRIDAKAKGCGGAGACSAKL